MRTPRTEDELDALLSQPPDRTIEALRATDGDVLVLGAGGKMGPTLTLMAQRALDQLPGKRRVIAVSRFSSSQTATRLANAGVEVIGADLSDPDVVSQLPDAPNVIFMAGQKFGTADAPARTWYTNTAVAAFAAHRYRHARVVAFSTGNVYALSPVAGDGSREEDAPAPVGEYAASCLGRERMFEHAALTYDTRVAIIRLNYAVDLRYGVLVDIATRVLRQAPVATAMGFFNCIWQGDANAIALAALAHAANPPFVLNVTGPERLAVRSVAMAFAQRFGIDVQFDGTEAPDALLSNTDRMRSLFGPPSVDAEQLMSMVAEWLAQGGPTLNKATHFEERSGSF